MKVTIAPDLEGLLPPLSEAELATLQANCDADPQHTQMPPVIVWGNHHNTIIDGHNQYKYRASHGLKIRYLKKNFETREEALRVALEIQFGRRNCNPSQRALAYAKLPRQAVGGDRRSDHSANLPNDSVQELAEKAWVSTRTMTNAVKVIDHGAADVHLAVLDGTVSIHDAAAIADLPKARQSQAAKKVRAGKAKTLRLAAEASNASHKPGQIVGGDVRMWETFDNLYGKIIRLVDDLNRGFPDKEQHGRSIALLRDLHKAVKSWREAPA